MCRSRLACGSRRTLAASSGGRIDGAREPYAPRISAQGAVRMSCVHVVPRPVRRSVGVTHTHTLSVTLRCDVRLARRRRAAAAARTTARGPRLRYRRQPTRRHRPQSTRAREIERETAAGANPPQTHTHAHHAWSDSHCVHRGRPELLPGSPRSSSVSSSSA